MNTFSAILNSLEVHRNKVDKLITEFRKQDASNRATFSDAYYKTSHEELVSKYKEKIAAEKSRASETVNLHIDNIQTSLNNWICSPISESTVNLLLLIKSSGMKLSMAEVEALEGKVGNSYFGNRLVTQLAQENGVSLPRERASLDVYERALKNCISASSIIVGGYYGDPVEKSLMPNNVSPHIAAAAAVGAPLQPESSFEKAALLWDGEKVPAPKTRLTADDTDIIDNMFSDCRGDDIKIGQKMNRILQESPELSDVMKLSKYRQYVQDRQEE